MLTTQHPLTLAAQRAFSYTPANECHPKEEIDDCRRFGGCARPYSTCFGAHTEWHHLFSRDRRRFCRVLLCRACYETVSNGETWIPPTRASLITWPILKAAWPVHGWCRA